MSAPALVFAMPGNERLAQQLAQALEAEAGALALHRFPDGESLPRLGSDPAGRQTLLVCSLHRPDEKTVPLLLAAATLRELGASRVGLVAPYLSYMRQDARFGPGEGVNSRHFARLLSASFDWLVTVDPHLHRHATLDAVYAIPCRVAHAAPQLAHWVRHRVTRPLLIGPDAESRQWVNAVAQAAQAPWVLLEKQRHGDREVELSAAEFALWRQHTPVLLDDIVSSGGTMIEGLRLLRRSGLAPAVCLAVHAVFAGQAYEALQREGAGAIVTTDTIPHPSNAVDCLPAIAPMVRALLAPSGAT